MPSPILVSFIMSLSMHACMYMVVYDYGIRQLSNYIFIYKSNVDSLTKPKFLPIHVRGPVEKGKYTNELGLNN